MYDTFQILFHIQPQYLREKHAVRWKLCLVLARGIYVCQITCKCNCKFIMDLLLFAMRNICMDGGGHFACND